MLSDFFEKIYFESELLSKQDFYRYVLKYPPKKKKRKTKKKKKNQERKIYTTIYTYIYRQPYSHTLEYERNANTHYYSYAQRIHIHSDTLACIYSGSRAVASEVFVYIAKINTRSTVYTYTNISIVA